MKARVFVSMALALVHAHLAAAQTVVTRVRVSDGKGYDERPLLTPLANGTYAVVWDRTTGDVPINLQGRVVRPDGTMATPVKKGVLGPPLNQYTSFSAKALGGTDRLVIAGTRASDTQIITRVYDSKLAAKSPLRASGQTGYDSRLAMASSGAVLAWNGTNGAVIAPVDTTGVVGDTPLGIDSTSTSTFLQPTRVGLAPGGYCVAGLETKADYSTARPATIYVPADLSAPGTLSPLRSAFGTGSFYPDAAFLDDTGYSVFGLTTSDSASAGYLRKLKSDGRPTGGAKKFPVSGAGFTAYYRIIPLIGSDRYAVAWYNFGDGLMYVQLRSDKGAVLADAVPVSDNSYSIDDSFVDLAYDAATARLLVVYSEFPAIPITHQDVMLAVFDVSAVSSRTR